MGLDGKDIQLLSDTLAHVILKTHVWYVARLKHCTVSFPIYFWFIQFKTLTITLFAIVCINCSVCIYSTFYLLFFHGAGNPYEVVRDRARFCRKICLPPKLGKWTRNRPKARFLEFIKTFGHSFLMNLIYNENLYYLLCFCTNPIFGKIFVS